MPQPIPRAIRERIVKERAAGDTVRQVAQQARVSMRSVRRITSAWRAQGEEGLNTHYARGPRGSRYGRQIYRQAISLKRKHPRWGGGLIRVELQARHPPESLPAERTLQAWFQGAGLKPPAHRLVRTFHGRGKKVHAVWEMDAKDHLHLGDGSPACLVSIQDECSGAALGTQTFPPGELATGAGGLDATLVTADVSAVGPARVLARR